MDERFSLKGKVAVVTGAGCIGLVSMMALKAKGVSRVYVVDIMPKRLEKAIELGADGVIIARPFVSAVYGGGAEGVQCYVDKIGAELEDTMAMCGAKTLADITPDMIWKVK